MTPEELSAAIKCSRDAFEARDPHKIIQSQTQLTIIAAEMVKEAREKIDTMLDDLRITRNALNEIAANSLDELAVRVAMKALETTRRF